MKNLLSLGLLGIAFVFGHAQTSPVPGIGFTGNIDIIDSPDTLELEDNLYVQNNLQICGYVGLYESSGHNILLDPYSLDSREYNYASIIIWDIGNTSVSCGISANSYANGSKLIAFNSNHTNDSSISFSASNLGYSHCVIFDAIAGGNSSLLSGPGISSVGDYILATGKNIAFSSSLNNVGVEYDFTFGENLNIFCHDWGNQWNKHSFVFGKDSETQFSHSFTFGQNLKNHVYGQFLFGQWNNSSKEDAAHEIYENSPYDGWFETEPAFVLANGTAADERSNAFVLYKDGSLAIDGSAYIEEPSHGVPAGRFGEFLNSDGSNTVLPPDWWEYRDVVDTVAAENTARMREENRSILAAGQLMLMAECAAQELNSQVEDGAGEKIASLLAEFVPYSASSDNANYEPVNLGQLKYVAEVFYERLHELPAGAVVWPEDIEFLSGEDAEGYAKYPWVGMPDSPADADYDNNLELATVSQCKYLFSWKIVGMAGGDGDGDGIPDSWEIEHFGKTNIAETATDQDGDGLVDKDEYLAGTDPNLDDTDGDGLSDGSEVQVGSNPKKADSDGINDVDESSQVAGYACSALVSEQWVDISQTGTVLQTLLGKANACEEVPLEFDISIFGKKYSSAFVSTNGTISFGKAFSSSLNLVANGDEIRFFPFWDNLRLLNVPEAKICYKRDNGKILISWIGLEFAASGVPRVDFQAEISSDGKIVYRYGYVTPGNAMASGSSATIGMQFNSHYYVNFSHNRAGSVASGKGIVLTPLRTNPALSDTDGDGLHDGWEIKYGTNPLSVDDTSLDFDNDGLTNLQECQIGTNPYGEDTDGDDMSDKGEVDHGLCPYEKRDSDLETDSDGDGIPNGAEIYLGLNPFNADDALLYNERNGCTNLAYYEFLFGVNLNKDHDGDGLPTNFEMRHNMDFKNPDDGAYDIDGDGLTTLQEFQRCTRVDLPDSDFDGILDGDDPDPLHPQTQMEDFDGDGMPDAWENGYGLNPYDPSDAAKDMDYDGLSNLGEFQWGSDPRDCDSDGDGMSDGIEAEYITLLETRFGLSHATVLQYINPVKWQDMYMDADGDGLNFWEEYSFGTNPFVSDTDGDGTGDSVEVNSGGNPNDGGDNGIPPPQSKVVEVAVSIGDKSGSQSEIYTLKIGNVSVCSDSFGNVKTQNVKLVKGQKYEISIIHNGTRLADGPDWDYVAKISGLDAIDGLYYMVDADSILNDDYNWDSGTGEAPFAGKKAFLYLLDPHITEFEYAEESRYEMLDDSGIKYGVPHWSDLNKDGFAFGEEGRVPIIYKRGAPPKIKRMVVSLGDFDVDDDLNFYHISGSYGRRGSIESEVLASVGGKLTFENMSGDFAISDTVDYIEDFKISWTLSTGYGKDCAIPVSNGNEMYIVNREPKNKDALYESVVHIVCTGGKGMSSDRDITDGIWSKFEGRNIKNKKGEPLYYYLNFESDWTDNVLTSELLRDRNGQCGAWTRLLLDTLKVHGISESGNYVRVGYIDSNNGILVKNWIFEGLGQSGLAPVYPYVNIVKQGMQPISPEYTTYIYREVYPDTVLPGQNNPYTPKSFSNHQFAHIGNKYMDPSYGTTSPSDRDFGLAGYYTRTTIKLDEENYDTDFNGNGNKTDKKVPMDVFLFKKHSENWIVNATHTE